MNGTDSSPSARVLGTTSTLVLSIWPSLGVAGKLATSVLALVLTLILAGSIVLSNAPPNAPHTKEVAALPGPERPRWYGWLLGNCLDLTEHRDSLINPAWAAAGRTGRYLSLLAQERVYTYDPAAVRYIFNHVDEFERPEDARRILGRIMGAGSLVAVNGAVHKRQRRVMDPAFSTTAIKDMVPAMFDKAVELENLLGRFVAEEGLEKYASAIPPKDVDRQVKGGRKVDMLSIMSRMTTDVIGQVFFQHDFDSLSQPEGSDIVHAFDRLVDAAHEAAPIAECQNAVPILDKIVRGEARRAELPSTADGCLHPLSPPRTAARSTRAASSWPTSQTSSWRSASPPSTPTTRTCLRCSSAQGRLTTCPLRKSAPRWRRCSLLAARLPARRSRVHCITSRGILMCSGG